MTNKEMRERRGKLAADMAALDLSVKENIAKFDAMDAEQNSLKEQIDRLERAEALDKELRTSRKPGEPPIDDDPDPTEAQQKEHRAFMNYLRQGWNADQYGFRGINEEDRKILTARRTVIDLEKRDMGTGGQGAYPGATAGFFVPVGFTMEIEEALKYFGDMWNVSQIMDTATGNPLPYPTDNDTTVTGEIIGEGQQVTTQDVSLGQIQFGAYKFSSKLVKVSMELLQDSAFDLEAFLIRKFATRLGRISNTMFTVGGGSSASQPTGIITAATSSGQTVIGDDNATTPDPTSQVGYIDLVNLEHSVDPLYRRGSVGSTYMGRNGGSDMMKGSGMAKFMFHDSTLRFIKTLKDKYGRPLWVPGMATAAPDTVNGYGYSINNDMAQLGPVGSPPVGSISVAFGPLDKYLIRRVKEMSVLRLVERFADYGQVAFLAFARYDGNLLDAGTHPVKYLQNAA